MRRLFLALAAITLVLIGVAAYRDSKGRDYLAIQDQYRQDHGGTFDTKVQQLFPQFAAAKRGDTFRVERCISCHVPDLNEIGPDEAAKRLVADFNKYEPNAAAVAKANGLTGVHPAYIDANVWKVLGSGGDGIAIPGAGSSASTAGGSGGASSTPAPSASPGGSTGGGSTGGGSAAGGNTAAAKIGTATVTIKATSDLKFDPNQQSAKVGDIVEWDNTSSGVPHNVTFDAPNASLSTSVIWNAGSTWQVKFATPGSYPYKCTIHPGMAGTLTVTGTAAAATGASPTPSFASASAGASPSSSAASPSPTAAAATSDASGGGTGTGSSGAGPGGQTGSGNSSGSGSGGTGGPGTGTNSGSSNATPAPAAAGAKLPGPLPDYLDPAKQQGGKVGIDQVGCIVCHNGQRLELDQQHGHLNLIVNPSYAFTKGAQLYYTYCVACHGTMGEGGKGPPLSNQDRLGFFNEDYYYRCIEFGYTDFEHLGSIMPAWGSASPDWVYDPNRDKNPKTVTRAIPETDIHLLVQFIRHWESYDTLP